MGYAPVSVVDGPRRLPLPYGLFSVVSLAESTTERWENGVTWQALSCDPAGIVVGDCDAPEGFPKQFPDEGSPIGEAKAFTVYGTYKCGPIGNPLGEAQARAREVLEAREEAAAEARLWSWMGFAKTDDIAGTDPVEVVGLLEKWIGDTYGSLGVIHVSRNAATTLVRKKMIENKGSQMFTHLGTPVVVGAGYPGTSAGGAPPTAGTEWIAASPALFGYRSQIFEASNRPGDLLDRGQNDLYGIAERNYLIGMDPCGVAFASITLGES